MAGANIGAGVAHLAEDRGLQRQHAVEAAQQHTLLTAYLIGAALNLGERGLRLAHRRVEEGVLVGRHERVVDVGKVLLRLVISRECRHHPRRGPRHLSPH